MMKRILLAGVLLACTTALSALPARAAEEQKYELKASSIKAVLAENLNKRVILRLDTGESLEGTVAKVGAGLVHIERLSGKDYFDAVVRIDQIRGVIFKVRGSGPGAS